jgi:hypothetical protein
MAMGTKVDFLFKAGFTDFTFTKLASIHDRAKLFAELTGLNLQA